MEAIFMNTENSKTDEPYKFGVNLWQRLDLRSSNLNILFSKTCLFITPGKS